MRNPAEASRALVLARLAAAGLLASAAAGCSLDPARYGAGPVSGPFDPRPDVTGSVPPAQAAPVQQVASQPLPPASLPPAEGRVPTHAVAPPPADTRWPPQATPPRYAGPPPQSVAAAPSPTYRPAAAAPSRPIEATGAVPRAGGADSWAWDGGTAVTVQPGESIDVLARRYGVPAAAIQRANNIADPRHIQPGQRLVIPAYIYRPAGTPPSDLARKPADPPTTASVAPASAGVHVVNPGDTLYALSRRYAVSHAAIAGANGLAPDAKLIVGQRLAIPGRPGQTARAPQPAATPAAAQPRPAVVQTAPAQPAPAVPRRAEAPVAPAAPAPVAVAETQPTESAAMVKPAVATAGEAKAEPASLGGPPTFRWPVKGRVISGFGAKPGGEKNDGINIAVPEGASVKAAEDGVVAYAGSELKGYGNLVLIRHAEGWVTAYAHNSELMVKKGDTVKRGQIIARAGQTGSVASPQLHFEIRRGSSPVDPAAHLSGG